MAVSHMGKSERMCSTHGDGEEGGLHRQRRPIGDGVVTLEGICHKEAVMQKGEKNMKALESVDSADA